jgi:hypothetical protein
MQITLRPMTTDDFKNYQKTAIPNYAQAKQKAESISTEQALKLAQDAYKHLLPDGVDTKGHFLFN